MGGLGSGRRSYASTPTVRECRHLDVNKFTETLDNVGARGRIWWGEKDDDTPNISFTVEGDDDAKGLRLRYTVRNPRTDEEEGYNYVVPIEYTPCNFGGRRPWFRCPNTECNERVAKLYCPRDGHLYLCRDCHNLSYQTSRASGDAVETAELRYRRAFEKADKDDRRPHPNSQPFFPEKPKGMHYDTFEDLLDDVRDAREEFRVAFNERMRSMLRGMKDYETELTI